jgi:hypothetical protein
MRRFAFVTLLVSASVALLSGCASDPSAQYFPANATPDSRNAVVDVGAIATPFTKGQLPAGPIARPDPKLTPGSIATTDVATICKQSKQTGIFSPKSRLVSPENQQTVFNSYHLAPQQAKHYGLDFLVPLQLGGANAPANIWPVPLTRGLGFHQKEVLNLRIHIVVCHGEIAIDQAQQAFESDWVKLWVLYGG